MNTRFRDEDTPEYAILQRIVYKEVMSQPPAPKPAPATDPAPSVETRTVTIPSCVAHWGMYSITVKLPWVCLVCGGPRGEPTKVLSYDGSLRMSCDGWENPCGHVEKYSDIRKSLGMEE